MTSLPPPRAARLRRIHARPSERGESTNIGFELPPTCPVVRAQVSVLPSSAPEWTQDAGQVAHTLGRRRSRSVGARSTNHRTVRGRPWRNRRQARNDHRATGARVPYKLVACRRRQRQHRALLFPRSPNLASHYLAVEMSSRSLINQTALLNCPLMYVDNWCRCRQLLLGELPTSTTRVYGV